MSSESNSFNAHLRRCALDQLDKDAGRGRVRVDLPRSWAQGRSTFGGLQAGLVLEGMAALVPDDTGPDAGPARRARSMQISFVGPVAGEAVLELERLRHGRSATIVRANILGGESTQEICATAIGCFASARESKYEHAAPSRPTMREPDGLISMPYVEGLTPSFIRYFELRWATGGPPGSGIASGDFHGWVRSREHVRGPGPAWVAALVDAWPAPALQMRRSFVPASSLNWTIDFIDGDPDAATDEWWAFAVETDRTAEGWSHTHARLWSPNGKLVATSVQLVALFG